MEEAFKVKWDEAMGWWKGQSDAMQKIIRRIASDKLEADGAEEVGSSDVNHAVYSMYQNYKAAECPELISFLEDYLY
jgi:hypothetical protein